MYWGIKVEILGIFEVKEDEANFVGYSPGKSYRFYNLGINVMKSVHVIFYDKKIQGLMDEGYHDAIKFKNEFEWGNDEFSDEETQILKKRSFEQLWKTICNWIR